MAGEVSKSAMAEAATALVEVASTQGSQESGHPTLILVTAQEAVSAPSQAQVETPEASSKQPPVDCASNQQSSSASLENNGANEGNASTGNGKSKKVVKRKNSGEQVPSANDPAAAAAGDGAAAVDKEKRRVTGLVTDPKERTRTAKKRGGTLVEAAKSFAERTGGQVFVKAKYMGGKAPCVFTYGDDFNLGTEAEDAPSQSPVVDTGVVLSAVEEGFRGALEKLDRAPSTSQGVSGLQTDKDLFASPSTPAAARPRRRNASGAGCIVCGEEGSCINIKGQQVTAEFFMCGKVGCRAKAHNECLGFPGVKFTTIAAVSTWYCHLHVGMGRPNPVELSDVDKAPDHAPQQTPASTKSAKGGDANPRRGRGRPKAKK